MKSFVGGLLLLIVVLFTQYVDKDETVLPASLGPFKGSADLPKNGPYPFGRYREPFSELCYGDNESFFRLKRWSFVSYTTQNYFVSFAVANLNYIANTFIYVVDTRTHEKVMEYTTLSPFPIPQLASFAPSSTKGCTEWNSGFIESLFDQDLSIKVCGKPEAMHVDLEYKDKDNQLSIHATSNFDEAMALLYPIATNRPAYTHKNAGMVTSGSITFNGVTETPVVTSIDWTYALSRRVTTWKWCSFQTILEDGTALGVNLSDEVYTDMYGVTQENAIWLDHKVIDFPADLQVTWDIDTAANRWKIKSAAYPAFLNLTFTPRGTREEHVNFGLIASDFVQPYGTFEGTVAGKNIANVYGVVEKHYAKW